MGPVQCQKEVSYNLYSDNRNHELLLDIKMYTWILSSVGSLKNQTTTLYTQCHFSFNLFGFSRSHQITSVIKDLLLVVVHSSFLWNRDLFISLHNHIICTNYSVNIENKSEHLIPFNETPNYRSSHCKQQTGEVYRPQREDKMLGRLKWGHMMESMEYFIILHEIWIYVRNYFNVCTVNLVQFII